MSVLPYSVPMKKIDLLKNAMSSQDWKKALSIASKFPRLGEHKNAIVRAHEALVNPRFYSQLGFNIDEVIQKGILALQERYPL